MVTAVAVRPSDTHQDHDHDHQENRDYREASDRQGSISVHHAENRGRNHHSQWHAEPEVHKGKTGFSLGRVGVLCFRVCCNAVIILVGHLADLPSAIPNETRVA